MKFYVGLHHPNVAHRFERAFISVNALKRRKGDFKANDWILDSGAFSTILTHGGYPEGVEVYAEKIRRWSSVGNLQAAVAQDYMCEDSMLKITGLGVYDHQVLTIERYDTLTACDTSGVYIMPVLQGYAPGTYVTHIKQYGPRLRPHAWVGVGSVCKRNASPGSIDAVLSAIKQERPDLRLHGFGLKSTALRYENTREMLYSADSMAWSFAARMEGRNPNDWREAEKFVKNIEGMPLQRSLLARKL